MSANVCGGGVVFLTIATVGEQHGEIPFCLRFPYERCQVAVETACWAVMLYTVCACVCARVSVYSLGGLSSLLCMA